MESLIARAAADRRHVPALAKQLVSQHVHIIADWDNLSSRSIKIQEFMRDDQSFIPVFSDERHFEQETNGSGFEEKGLSIDGNLFAFILKGDERLVLNPGSRTPVDLNAKDLKAFVAPERLPGGANEGGA